MNDFRKLNISWIFQKWKFIYLFYLFSKLHNKKISRILQFGKLTNFYNFFIWKTKIWLQELANFWIVHPFDILHYSQFHQFLYLTFDINRRFDINRQFRRFHFSIFIFKLSRSTFECSLIFKFEMSAILKYYYFNSHPRWHVTQDDRNMVFIPNWISFENILR